jgi:hypothetical protein
VSMRTEASNAWARLMAPPAIPKCYHGEAAKEFRVSIPSSFFFSLSIFFSCRTLGFDLQKI